MDKRLGYVCTVFLLALTLAGTAWAVESVQKQDQGGSSKTRMENSSAMTSASHSWRMGGVVSAVDPQNHTISIHQETVHHDWVRQWKVNKKAAGELSNIKEGDLVNVWGKGKTVTEIGKVS